MVISITKKEQTKKVMLYDLIACLLFCAFFYLNHATKQQIIPWVAMMLAVSYYSLVNLPNRAEISMDFFRRMMKKLNETMQVQAIGPCVRKEGRKGPSVAGALVLTDESLGFYPFIGKEQVADTSIFTILLEEMETARADKKSTLTICRKDGTEESYTVNKQKTWEEEINKLLRK